MFAMRPVSPAPPPPPSQQQQQQQQQQRRWQHFRERLPSFSAPSEVIRVPARAEGARRARGDRPLNPDDDDAYAFRRVLVLPGNPGAASFYRPFAVALHEELGGAEVVALSFHGHETTKERGEEKARPPLCLDGQVEHAAAFLEKMLAEVDAEEREKEGSGDGSRRESSPVPSVAVVGHSIGGTVAALAVREVEERRRRRRRRTQRKEEEVKEDSPPTSSPPASSPPRAEIAAVCAMMPYVAFDEASAQQRALRALAGSPLARVPACLGARALGALLPRAVLAGLVGLATASSPLSRHARETVADFVRAGGLDHALFLAGTEFRALAVSAPATAGKEKEKEEKGEEREKRKSKFSVSSASTIWEPLASLGKRASVFAVGGGGKASDGDGEKSGGDHWCPGHHLDLLKEQAPLATVELAGDQRHDFVVCDKRTAAAARAVAGLLRATASAAAAAEDADS